MPPPTKHSTHDCHLHAGSASTRCAKPNVPFAARISQTAENVGTGFDPVVLAKKWRFSVKKNFCAAIKTYLHQIWNRRLHAKSDLERFIRDEAKRLEVEAQAGFPSYLELHNHFTKSTIEAKGIGRALGQVELHLEDENLLPRKRQSSNVEDSLPVAAQPKRQRLPERASVESITEEVIDLREEKLYTPASAILWARGSHAVENYVTTLIAYTNQGDVRLKQQGRHLLRLLRDCGALDSAVLAQITDVPSNSWVKRGATYNESILSAVFQHSRGTMKILDSLKSEGLLRKFDSFWFKLGMRTPPSKTLMTDASVITLIETSLKIPMGASEVDEEDVRSVWAAATRAALPAVGDTGVGVSLEFAHTFQSEGDADNKTKSDVTIYVAHDVNDIGACVMEVEKVELGLKGRIHKDLIKAPGEAI
ncbi:hypothetical protein DFS34DRAFT_440486 [Phlyctochytrium arcticum]|nr:hypothetical protein DFS34DRAFT_440486 [Phlyctochytrium arcticum]